MTIGQKVGPYRIDALLGRGGMAEVYRAFHVNLHRLEALKALPPQMTFDRSFVDRFLHEARVAANLHHPHIATIHTVSEADATLPFFTMELIEGGDLADLLEQRGSLSLEQGLPILRQIAEALDYAHQQGVIHRDVKPANVLLQPDGIGYNVKVVDFGIARAQEEPNGARLTKTGMIVGTPAYMSPEQGGSGPAVDRRSDIYSLGVIAYEMLCGTPPFHAAADTSPISIIMQHVRDAPLSPIQRVPGLPQSVNNAILTALAKNPEDRFDSCTAFIGALTVAPPPKPAKPRPERTVLIPPKRAGLAPRRSFLVPVLVGLGAFGGAGLIGWALFHQSTSPTPKSVALAPAPVPTVAVPDVGKMTGDQASDYLKSKSLHPELTTGPSGAVASGLVMNQYPVAGTAVPTGATVRVRVSTGPSPEDQKRMADQQQADEARRIRLAEERAARDRPHTGNASSTDSPPTSSSSDDRDAITTAINGWVGAWEQQDAAAHMDYYARDARIYSNGHWSSYDEYYRDRQDKFSKGGSVTVTTSSPNIELHGDTADVSYRTNYHRTGGLGSLTRTGREKIHMRKVGGRWLIDEDVFTKS